MKNINNNSIAIKHDQQHQMFYIKLKEGAAHIKYDKPEKDLLDIKETFVPKNSRSLGLADILAEHILNHAKKLNKAVIASCSFVQHFIQNNPKYKSLVYSH